MKKVLAFVLVLVFAFVICGCGEEKTTYSDKSKNEDTASTVSKEDTEENLLDDSNVMLDFLIDAEEINSKISDVISDYNDDVVSLEDTVKNLEELQKELRPIKESLAKTTWKTQKYEKRAETITLALDNLDKFFTTSIEGLEEQENWKLTKAEGYRTDYQYQSEGIYNDIKRGN